jgi:hypothetical protein
MVADGIEPEQRRLRYRVAPALSEGSESVSLVA